MTRGHLFPVIFSLLAVGIQGQVKPQALSLLIVPLAGIRAETAAWKDAKLEILPDSELLRRGIFYARLAVEMEKTGPLDSQRGFACLERYCSKNPKDMLALTWLGMAYSLRARDSWNPFEQMDLISRGIDALDKAVNESRADPYLWFCRFIRGNIYCELPGMFNKGSEAENDQMEVIKAIGNDKEFSVVLVGTYCYLGILREKTGRAKEAIQWYEKAAAIGITYGFRNQITDRASGNLDRLIRSGIAK